MIGLSDVCKPFKEELLPVPYMPGYQLNSVFIKFASHQISLKYQSDVSIFKNDSPSEKRLDRSFRY